MTREGIKGKCIAQHLKRQVGFGEMELAGKWWEFPGKIQRENFMFRDNAVGVDGKHDCEEWAGKGRLGIANEGL